MADAHTGAAGRGVRSAAAVSAMPARSNPPRMADAQGWAVGALDVIG